MKEYLVKILSFQMSMHSADHERGRIGAVRRYDIGQIF